MGEDHFEVEEVKKNPKKIVMVILLVIVGAGVIGYGGYWAWQMTPPGMPSDLNEASAMMASSRFSRLSDDRKEQYFNRVREMMDGMDAEQRRGFWERNRQDKQFRDNMRDGMRMMMVNRAKDFAAADEMKRTMMLDEAINQMQAMRQQWAGRGGGGNRPDPETMTEEQKAEMEKRRAEKMERAQGMMQERAETGNPQESALMGEFRTAMKARMEERGIEMGWGRGDGGKKGK
ncbi:hypothetical protein [Poriferisphaera sp. WC338]|uniref:hypothetical protein n=1 Tax=Poriferisphaera sp. WC338 TaxID=3425129 RepID=UPI003D815014